MLSTIKSLFKKSKATRDGKISPGSEADEVHPAALISSAHGPAGATLGVLASLADAAARGEKSTSSFTEWLSQLCAGSFISKAGPPARA